MNKNKKDELKSKIDKIESMKGEIRRYIDELKSLGYDYVVDELADDLEKIGVLKESSQISEDTEKESTNKLLNTKLLNELKKYANENIKTISTRSKKIASKIKSKSKEGIDVKKCIYVSGIALAMIGFVGNQARKAIENNGYEDKLEEQHMDVYTPYTVAYNDSGYVNFRNAPSTKDGEVIFQLPIGDTVFILDDDSSIEGEGDHDWRQAIYRDGFTNEYVDGYIDAGWLNEKDVSSVTILVKDNGEISEEGTTEPQVYEYEPYEVDAKTLDFIVDPSTNKIISTVENGKTVYIYNDDLMKSDSDCELQPGIYYDEEAKKYVRGFVDVNYVTEKQGCFGYKDVEFTDEDIKNIADYIHSWENQALYSYLKGYGASYDNEWVSQYITEDGKYYICETDKGCDNGTKNYGFGVMVMQNGYVNYQVADLFAERGYDVTKSEISDKIPVEVVDEVSEAFVSETIKTIKACLKNRDVRFSKNEILALTGICYQFGRDENFINRFIDYYIQYGGNTEELRDNFITEDGTTYPLIEVAGAIDTNFGYNRGEANWMAFHDGDFVMGIGPVSKIRFDEETKKDITDETEATNPTQESIEEER